MKIRQGFVSNSSSSSFLIRGITINIAEWAKQLGISLQNDSGEEEDEGSVLYTIGQKLGIKWEKDNRIELHSMRDFFDGLPTGYGVIGIELIDLDDGVVYQIPEPDDNMIRKKLSKVLKKEITEPLHTYIQFISNVNY